MQVLVSFVALQRYFCKKRKLAAGIFTAAFSIGLLSWPILTELLIQTYSWKGAMIILGAVQLNGFACGALLRPIKVAEIRRQSHAQKTQADESHNTNGIATIVTSFRKDHWTSRWVPFSMFCFAVVLMYGGHQVIHAYTPMRAESLGLTKYEGAFLVSLIGITGLPCRPMCGILGDKMNSCILFGIAGMASGTLNILVCAVKSYVPYAIITGLFGITAGRVFYELFVIP